MIRNSGNQSTQKMSTKVLEWLDILILVSCKVKGIYELEARESKNSFYGLCSL